MFAKKTADISDEHLHLCLVLGVSLHLDDEHLHSAEVGNVSEVALVEVALVEVNIKSRYWLKPWSEDAHTMRSPPLSSNPQAFCVRSVLTGACLLDSESASTSTTASISTTKPLRDH